MKNIIKFFIILNFFLASFANIFAEVENGTLASNEVMIEKPENSNNGQKPVQNSGFKIKDPGPVPTTTSSLQNIEPFSTYLLNKIKNHKGKFIAAFSSIIVTTLGSFFRGANVSNKLKTLYQTKLEETEKVKELIKSRKARRLEVFNDFTKKQCVQNAIKHSDKLKKCPIKVFQAKKDNCPTCPVCKGSFEELDIKFKDNSSPFCFMPCCNYQSGFCLDCFIKSYSKKDVNECSCLSCNTTFSSNLSEINELDALIKFEGKGQTKREAINNFMKQNNKKWDNKKTYKNIVDQICNEVCKRDMEIEKLTNEIENIDLTQIEAKAKSDAIKSANEFRSNLNPIDKALLSGYEKLQQHKKEILVGTGLTAAAVGLCGLVYYLYKKGFFKRKPKPVDEDLSDLNDLDFDSNDDISVPTKPNSKPKPYLLGDEDDIADFGDDELEEDFDL